VCPGQGALGRQRQALGACACGIPAASGGFGGEQSAQAQACSSNKRRRPARGQQRTAHGGTAALQELGEREKFSIKFFFVLCCVRWMVV